MSECRSTSHSNQDIGFGSAMCGLTRDGPWPLLTLFPTATEGDAFCQTQGSRIVSDLGRVSGPWGCTIQPGFLGGQSVHCLADWGDTGVTGTASWAPPGIQTTCKLARVLEMSGGFYF